MTPQDWTDLSETQGRLTIAGVPEGYDALVLADIVRARGTALHVARDDARMATLVDAIRFFAPEIEILRFPAWDCLPYDRSSPHADIAARRVRTLALLAERGTPKTPRLILTTVNAASQRVPSRAVMAAAAFSMVSGKALDLAALTSFLAANGYSRTGTVMEPGEFAIRGGIVDIFPAGSPEPVRLDLFGDEIDVIRSFDPLTQRSSAKIKRVDLVPASEVLLSPEAIRRFRAGYVESFGTVMGNDPLYEAVSEGRKHIGMEHWLPLFHERLETIFDYAGDAILTLDPLTDDALAERFGSITDYYRSRKEQANLKSASGIAPYKPLPPESLYLTADDWQTAQAGRDVRVFTPHHLPEDGVTRDLGGRLGRDFAIERNTPNANIYDALRQHVEELQASGKRVLLASYSAGARERLQGVISDHGLRATLPLEAWAEAGKVNRQILGLLVLPLEHGFETADLALITEQDVLGDRLVRKARRQKRADNFLTEAAALIPGDYVVHVDHGVGRFEGLITIEVMDAPHDCVMLVYDGGDKLYVPVENIEVLSRYGSEDSGVILDKLGGTAWQSRKAKLKKRIREMADEVIKLAAARALRQAEVMDPAEGLYDEFCARFPYAETEDQLRAIGDVIDDLGQGRPMDRLICGDVGFGKTEVALRAAFVAAMSGFQVAVVVPTTLLARQHYKGFEKRFQGLPIRIGQLSRLVGDKELRDTKAGLTDGKVDIVIGTHALLGKAIAFKNLGLLIVDEEQHFGVSHKERLKQLKSNVHVLTLTATPIPRTLHMAMSGLKELSLIATPPVDRLAVRTFVLPQDPMVIREALLREHYRGGQSFYVVPRISDLDEVMAFIRETVPEVKIAIAHGQMAPSAMDEVMNAFYDGQFDVLLSTTIVESGLDIPTANTLIVHRADMFGLAQLYQLRGRVGRSKTRAYAYMTLPQGKLLTANAEKRLQVLQTLDTLGAGFTLASHDLDIRGAGNLLGDEQSGHIREVGLELYQQMLEEAVAEARAGGLETEFEGHWSPQIALGATVLLPESYVGDLNVRMSLYRRLADLTSREEIDAFAAELIDRFGPLPDEVKQLLVIIEIKGFCRQAGIEKIEAGPRGATVTFRKGQFANPLGLVDMLSRERGTAKLKPDQRLVIIRDWPSAADRLKGALALAKSLAKIALGEPVTSPSPAKVGAIARK
ncbi:transcription-repair coupling factor [Govanella unica]|uniref:Transcription-repair-coupling factor n=1 Tax=Govanella unica TaxID=2975056 RepID=A0A9X3Z6Z8_9PROT|nr:transcription-repair coupling factor [Govania unica]MDA5193637.1 transcription-repair coupling factor [Govania unica]